MPVSFTLSLLVMVTKYLPVLEFPNRCMRYVVPETHNLFTIVSMQPNLSPLTSHYTNSHTNNLQPSINCEGWSAVQTSFQWVTDQTLPFFRKVQTQGTDFYIVFRAKVSWLGSFSRSELLSCSCLILQYRARSIRSIQYMCLVMWNMYVCVSVCVKLKMSLAIKISFISLYFMDYVCAYIHVHLNLASIFALKSWIKQVILICSSPPPNTYK